MKKIARWPMEFPGALWMDGQEERAVLDVLRHGSLFRYYGPGKPRHVDRFEALARRYYQVPYALGVNSGTGALMTAMRALGIGAGCEVIVPAYMWVATIGAVVCSNAIPVLCEIDDSFTLDPADLERKITPRTRLIVPVHMNGAPCDMKAIMAIADRHGIPVLEDCAQCNGGAFAGRKVGTFGPIGMFSFQINKNCTTGEGGLLVAHEEKTWRLLNAAHDVGVPWLGGGPKADSDAVTWGGGRRMSELIGAVAAVQLAKLPRIVRHMRASRQRIQAQLQDPPLPGVRFRRIHDLRGETGSFLIMICADEGLARRVLARLRPLGLTRGCRLADFGLHIYSNIPQLVGKVGLSPAGEPWSLPQNRRSVYRYGPGACPRSDDLFARSLLLPIPSRLTRAQEEAAAAAIRRAVLQAGPG